MSGDLAAFLRARFDEDERWAQTVSGHSIFDGTGIVTQRNPGTTKTVVIGPHVARYIARHDPARVLAEVEAKRRIVDLWEDPAEVETFPEGVYDGRDPDEVETQVAIAETIDHIVRLLALPYADHPDYRPEEWKP